MTQSLLPEAELRAQFARRRTRQWVAVVPAALAIISISWFDDIAGWTTLPAGRG